RKLSTRWVIARILPTEHPRSCAGCVLRSPNPMATGPSQPSQREYVAPSERPSGLLVLLKRRYFRRMWAVTTVSSLGDWLGVFALYLVSASMEVLGQLWMPSKDATIPNLVERDQLMMANQLSQISTYASFPFAGALVALLVIPAHFLEGVFPSLKGSGSVNLA